MFNSYFNQVIELLLDNYQASNKTEEALKEVLAHEALVNMEYLFIFYLKPIYTMVRNHVQEDFEEM
jgi:hypothetical protein